MKEAPWVIGIALVALIVVTATTAGFVTAMVVAFIGLGFLVVALLGEAMAIDADRSWLTLLLPLAFLAKMAGAAARYYQVTVIYGSGDAFG